jgi:hypothetical protein
MISRFRPSHRHGIITQITRIMRVPMVVVLVGAMAIMAKCTPFTIDTLVEVIITLHIITATIISRLATINSIMDILVKAALQ